MDEWPTGVLPEVPAAPADEVVDEPGGGFSSRVRTADRVAETTEPEAKVTRRILDWLNSQPDTIARKVHQTAVTGGGEPDIDACSRGRCIKIEVKRVGAPPPPPRQIARLARWQRAGALVGWATSVEHVQELMQHVDDRSWINPLTGPGAPVGPPG